MYFILTRKAGLLKDVILHPQVSQYLTKHPEKLPWWYCQVIGIVTNTEGKVCLLLQPLKSSEEEKNNIGLGIIERIFWSLKVERIDLLGIMIEEPWIPLHGFFYFCSVFTVDMLQDAWVTLQVTEIAFLCFAHRTDVALELAERAFSLLSVNFSALPQKDKFVPFLTEFQTTSALKFVSKCENSHFSKPFVYYRGNLCKK